MTLDEKMEEIRAKKDPKSRLKAIVRPKDNNVVKNKNYNYSNRIDARALVVFNALGGLKGVKKFIKYCNETSDFQRVTADKYGVSINVVTRAVNMPEELLKTHSKVDRILKQRAKK